MARLSPRNRMIPTTSGMVQMNDRPLLSVSTLILLMVSLVLTLVLNVLFPIQPMPIDHYTNTVTTPLHPINEEAHTTIMTTSTNTCSASTPTISTPHLSIRLDDVVFQLVHGLLTRFTRWLLICSLGRIALAIFGLIQSEKLPTSEVMANGERILTEEDLTTRFTSTAVRGDTPPMTNQLNEEWIHPRPNFQIGDAFNTSPREQTIPSQSTTEHQTKDSDSVGDAEADESNYFDLHAAGYPVHLFTQTPTSDLICSICTGVVRHPFNLNCGHIFCGICLTLSTGRRCPLCRQFIIPKLHMTQLNRFLVRQIEASEINCPYQKDGCRWKGCIGTNERNILNHLKLCEFNKQQEEDNHHRTTTRCI